MQSLPKAVIFDMDGLLLDTEPLANQAIQHAAKIVLNVTLTEAMLMDMIGRSGRDCILYLEHALQRDISAEALNEEFYSHYEGLLAGGINPKPGCVELLNFLDAQDIPKIIATSSITNIAVKKLTKVGLYDRFVDIIGGDQVEYSKPNPAIYQLAARTINVSEGQCLALEDSENGVRAAHAAGIPVICVPDLKHPSKKIQQLAYETLPSLHHVRELLAA